MNYLCSEKSAFVFAYAKTRFSHDTAQLRCNFAHLSIKTCVMGANHYGLFEEIILMSTKSLRFYGVENLPALHKIKIFKFSDITG